MIISIRLGVGSSLTVKRIGKKVKNSGYSPIYGADHQLFYWVKQRLNGIGFNLMKVAMDKDKKFDHMTDGGYPYLRAKDNKLEHPHIWIYDGDYCIRNAAEDYNNGEEVRFFLDGNIWSPYVYQDNWQDLVRDLIARGDPDFGVHEDSSGSPKLGNS